MEVPMARRLPLPLLLWLLSIAAGAAPGSADIYGRSQHGGRATGQAGAFVARAQDPAAVGYNPAAIVRLEGTQLQAGLDFDAPKDEADSPGTSASAEHTIQFPPAVYFTWRPAGASWALGGGIDSPTWRLVDWETALFPGRFVARRSEATLFAFRLVAAKELGPRWSVGGGLRYLRGTLGYGDTVLVEVVPTAGPYTAEVDRLAEASADGVGFDVATHYAGEGWGFGATYASAVDVEGDGDLTYAIRDAAALPPAVAAELLPVFVDGRSTLSEELPEALTAGFWLAPYDGLRLELDLGLARFSAVRHRATDDPSVTPGSPFAIARRDGWDDTLSIRFGVEGDLADPRWKLSGGLALEPTPAGGTAIEPGAARGDALVYAVGASFDLDERLSFDLGYSFHDFESLGAGGLDGGAVEDYAAHSQVFAVSARWRLGRGR
jgi:long-chain fatty acid transport protein